MSWIRTRKSPAAPETAPETGTATAPDSTSLATSLAISGPTSGGARRAHLTILVSLVLLTFLQRPGSTTFDTKFDLTAGPGRFLEKTLHLWNPELSFGELQNQAYGYLFPQGPFFLLGDLADIPDWIVQRGWSALLLVAAYDGARRLMRAFGPVASPWLPIVAGLAYALSPRLLGLSGVLTAEVLPSAVLPWVVLPLVHALRGRISVQYGALLSGVAVLFMGGVNAVENLAALPLPVLLLVSTLGTARGRRLAVWWVGAVGLACSWWVLPLLVLGRYSPPFLDYIETSAATTDPLGWVNSTRGADHWLAFVNVGGQPWWPGAFDLATAPHLIALTAVVAAISLFGLFHPSMPARRPLAISALLGLVLLTVAHVAPLSSPLSGVVRELLDGPLSPLRNVHKVDPIIRLPLALGLAHSTGVLLGSLSGGPSGDREQRPRRQRLGSVVAIGSVLVLLVLSAQPLVERTLRKPGWDAVPNSWQQTTDYLAEHADGRRALVLPGSGFGQQTWGWTIDEPIQGLARSPWVTRSQVPLVPGPTIRFLDSIEDRIVDGRGSPVLADLLARSGIGHVVVRRDLDLFASEAPSPARVDQALARSPGLVEVASFGSAGVGDLPAISIYDVRRTVPRVEAVGVEGVSRLAGGPEDLITALEAGLLGAGEPVEVTAKEPDLVGDGYRLRERQFGRLRGSLSQIMTLQERYRNDRRAHDYPGVEGISRVHADYPGISALSASSSSGYADSLGEIRPELGPYSAVDGVTDTFWRSAPLENPRGQWVAVRLRDAQPLTQLDLAVGVDGFSGVPVRRVRVDAGDQRSEHAVDPETGAVRVELSGAPVRLVRITVLETLGDPRYGVVAIREISFPGLPLGRTLAVPGADASAATGFAFRAQPERRACVRATTGLSCEVDSARPSEEESGLRRSFATSEAGTWVVSGGVVARSSLATAQLLWPLGGQIRAEASSVLSNDPAVSGQFAVDGAPGTDWLSSNGDLEPSLSLSWDGERTLTRVRISGANAPARAPVRAIIESGGDRREVDLTSGSLGIFEPLRTDRVKITFPIPPGSGPALPVGIGELLIDGIENLTYQPDSDAATGAACELGPGVFIDGRPVPVRVVGTIGDVLGGGALRLEPCGGPVQLDAGQHVVDVVADDRFVPTALTLTPDDAGPVSVAAQRTTEIRSWTSTERSVEVGPGAAALLRIPENYNDGWRATLNGTVLQNRTLDGWQQAYAVPAGAGGVVRLVYTPDGPYRLALLVGGVVALFLIGAVLAMTRRERRRLAAPIALPRAWSAGVPRGPYSGLLLGGSLVAVTWVIGGVPVLLGALVGLLLHRTDGRRRWLAAATVALSGVAAAVVAEIDPRTSWTVLDLLTGAAIGLLLVTLINPAPGTTQEVG